MSNALATQTKQFDLSPQTFDQALTFSKYLADSEMVPKDFKGKPGNCLIAMQWGAELGLKPMQALQNLAVINGRPALWGDAVIALVRSSPLCEYVQETDDGHTATCRVKRRGEPEQIRTFSMDDAKAAGLAGKQGPWVQYPRRMRQMRARAFALRDVFPDVLRGMPVAEELQDMPSEHHMGDAQLVAPAPPANYPQEAFERNLDSWAKNIASGRKSMQDLVAMVSTKGALTKEQQSVLANAVQRLQANTVEAAPASDLVVPAPIAITFEKVKAALDGAAEIDALYIAADLMGELPDPQQRAELAQIFERRQLELEAN